MPQLHHTTALYSSSAYFLASVLSVITDKGALVQAPDIPVLNIFL